MKFLKKMFAAVALVAGVVVFTNCNNEEATQGNSPLMVSTVKDIRTVPTFNQLDVSSAINVVIQKDDVQKVEVEFTGEELRTAEQLKNVTTNVSDGKLTIRRIAPCNGNECKVTVYITVKELTSVKASGASLINSTGTFAPDTFSFDLDGASQVTKFSLEANTLTTQLSGASNLTLSGKANQHTFNTSGASRFAGFDFNTSISNVTVSGASSAEVVATSELSGSVSNASSVSYKANSAKVTANADLSSRLVKVN